MSTDTDRAAAEKAEADKKAAEDAAAAATVIAAAWPIGGYTSLIPLVFLSVVALLAICVDVSTMCVVHALLDRNQCVINAVNVMLMFYSWINLFKNCLFTQQSKNLISVGVFRILVLLLH